MLIGLRHTSAVDSFQVEKVKQSSIFFVNLSLVARSEFSARLFGCLRPNRTYFQLCYLITCRAACISGLANTKSFNS